MPSISYCVNATCLYGLMVSKSGTDSECNVRYKNLHNHYIPLDPLLLLRLVIIFNIAITVLHGVAEMIDRRQTTTEVAEHEVLGLLGETFLQLLLLLLAGTNPSYLHVSTNANHARNPQWKFKFSITNSF